MIQVTLPFASAAVAAAALKMLADNGYTPQATALGNASSTPAVATPTASPAPAAARASTKPAATPAASAGPAAAAPAASSEKPAAGAETSDTATLEYEKDVKPLVIKAGATKGREAVAALFAELGVAKGPELKPEQLADAKARFEALIG